MIILAISFCGEVLKNLIPLPIPASIYGMLLLFTGLATGIIPLNKVKETGNFLIEIMPVMFIPAGVGLMSSFGILRPMLIPVSLITVITVITVMLAAGHVSQFFIRQDSKRKKEAEHE